MANLQAHWLHIFPGCSHAYGGPERKPHIDARLPERQNREAGADGAHCGRRQKRLD